MSFVADLLMRGLVHQQTHPQLDQRLPSGSLYIGFDPTAPTLHVGSLLQIVVLMRAQRAGLTPIALVGGATGMIGDPSGKREERKLLDPDTLQANVEGLRATLSRFLDFSPSGNGAQLVNNHDWLGRLGYLEFLRDVGKAFSVNMMLAKDSVRARLEDRDRGISYTEFSYMLIQAYDFLWLYEHHGCRLQCGASDQWGNITAGIELVRRTHGVEVYGLTTPLVTDSAGNKFGKTEKGAVWLDAARTSPYELYQFFVRTTDRDVGRYLRYYTFLDGEELGRLDRAAAEAPERREAQRVLAHEVTTLVHGADEAARAQRAAATLFGGGAAGRGADGASTASASTVDFSDEALDAIVQDSAIARMELPLSTLGLSLASLLAETKLSSSGGAAKRDVAGGGIYLNGQRVTDPQRPVTAADLQRGDVIVLRKGKANYHVVRFVAAGAPGGSTSP
jgi:tyrosyl-tRNA synthetase